MGYFDDSFTFGDSYSYKQYKAAVTEIAELFRKKVSEKSQLIPTQENKYIGFIINSKEIKSASDNEEFLETYHQKPVKTDWYVRSCIDSC